ncbi:unnamed protein product [Hermetia illucens]|uniref:Uncharacterized protein n=1 Tax=Hermetia illucens TaxID=343691 RepID=A0A7R8UAA0_HERIL|nr:unnamed protein product [Hermetia illucens]
MANRSDLPYSEKEVRRYIMGPKTSFALKCVVIVNILGIACFGCYLFRSYYSSTKEVTNLPPSLQIPIPGLIQANETLDYHTFFEEYLVDSTDESIFTGEDNDFRSYIRPHVRLSQVLPLESSHVMGKLKAFLKCNNQDFKSKIVFRNNYYVLKNYYRAAHGEIECYTAVTYATHGDYTNLENLRELVNRWDGPISVALYAPGKDFQRTLNSIKYVLNCLPESPLIRLFVTFHIYIPVDHIPGFVRYNTRYVSPGPGYINCASRPPYKTNSEQYRVQKKILYPINVGRNIARDGALTHFILDADIDMYPSAGLNKKFLEMVAADKSILQMKLPKVFALPVFEVAPQVTLPRNKTDLQELVKGGKAHFISKGPYAKCNSFMNADKWLNGNETGDISVFHVAKRMGPHKHWEPFFIGTQDEPEYNERFSREGELDRTALAYTLCVLDYDFLLLDNAFLVHQIPAAKMNQSNLSDFSVMEKTQKYLLQVLYPQLKEVYGFQKGCSILHSRTDIPVNNATM